MELQDVNTYSIHGAYFSLCPVEKSNTGGKFSFSKDSTHNYITQRVFPGMMNDQKLTVLDTNE